MLYGSSANAVFTYNEIDHNYTGFYLTAGATANLGDLNNADPDDDGYNCIYDNLFFTGEEFTVYNASSADLTAENTVWDDDPPIDTTIIDGNDNAAYGIVDYEPTLSPFAPPAGINAVLNNGFVNVTVEPGTAYPTYKTLEGYNLYRDGSFVATMTSLFYIDPFPPTPGTTCTYGASIIYEGGYESVIVDTTIYIPHILNPPQNPFVSLLGLFSWEPPEPGSTSNLLYCKVFLDGTLLGPTYYSPYQFTGLTSGDTYFAEVSAVYEDGESVGVGVQFYYLGEEYEPPQNAGYEVFSDHINLYWEEPNQFVEEYHIYVDGVLHTTTELYFDIYDLIPGQVYEVALTAFYIDQIESDPIVFNIAFVEGDDILNLETKLLGNYPNPFNPTTTISFSVTQTSPFAKIEIYNLKGQKIKTLTVTESQSPKVSVVWDGTDQNNKPVSSGVYFYQLKAGNQIFTKKMLMMK
ncbi:MAG: T9SS type A sorting domain-containing protein [Candidatus Cloacimonetes bacterium]|nr:T9SS type A sorting domain-containing protein [Candidatus Cloacimonadota bacterium]MCF7814807.1 T9SS type A sorting domain-containing protein [Candidatus Cloacimonadota bacterium]MCF7869198.1 T9SS type A sorting domain-containing protein [Candidatus Cloacimonadota bacterium]MCF7884625.1 T9SS type A sorting domain-containing protein [Candidatus Cloacimonadota bacterium]